MSVSTALPPAGQLGVGALLQVLFDATDTGLMQLSPVYRPGTTGEVVDFRCERLNPAAQRLLGLPEHPAAAYRALAPHDAAGLAILRAAFASGTAGHYVLAGHAAGGRPYPVRVVAQRVGPQLVASLTADEGPAPPHPAAAPPAAGQPEGPAAAAPAPWAQLLEQAPVAVTVLRGPRHLVEVANPIICALWRRSRAQVLGQPLFEVLPEAAGLGLEELLAEC